MDPYLKKIVIEDFFSGNPEAYEKWQRVVEFRIQIMKNKVERDRRAELKGKRLEKDGLTQQKKDKYEDEE